MVAKRPKRGDWRRSDGPVCLASGMEKRLAAYASAAVAAGVSWAASAEAKIVYTPGNTPISGWVSLDLNHDGVDDFAIVNGRYASAALWVGCAVHTTFALPPKGVACNYLTDQIWGRGVVSGRFASALPAGFKVGASKPYFQAAQYPFLAVMGAAWAKDGCSTYPCTATSGQWLNTRNRYLGLQFVINGQIHYGWARFNVLVEQRSLHGRGLSAVLTGYAYETVPNKPIMTGKIKGPDVITLDPATLGHLAAGASQIPAWRGARNRERALPDSRQETAPKP